MVRLASFRIFCAVGAFAGSACIPNVALHEIPDSQAGNKGDADSAPDAWSERTMDRDIPDGTDAPTNMGTAETATAEADIDALQENGAADAGKVSGAEDATANDASYRADVMNEDRADAGMVDAADIRDALSSSDVGQGDGTFTADGPDSGWLGDTSTYADAACSTDAGCAACPKRVFVTENFLYPDFGGLVGADAVCQNEASNAGLCGTWMAWLADDTGQSPATRFVRATSGYVRTDGVQVASSWADLTDGTLNAPINVTAARGTGSGTLVWTDVDTTGVAGWPTQTTNPGSCHNWASRASGSYAGAGSMDRTTSEWTASQILECSGVGTRYPLYCFEQ